MIVVQLLHQQPVFQLHLLIEKIVIRITDLSDFEKNNPGEKLVNHSIISLSLSVSNFVNDTMVQYNLFEDNSKKDHLRKVVYDLKDKFGKNKLMRAIEVREGSIMQDVIGFGSVKDLYNEEQTELMT